MSKALSPAKVSDSSDNSTSPPPDTTNATAQHRTATAQEQLLLPAASAEPVVPGGRAGLHDEPEAVTEAMSCTSATEREHHSIECLLLEDATKENIPLHLRQLLQPYTVKSSASVDSVGLTPSELLLLLVYTVALESGYLLDDTTAEGRVVSGALVGLPAAFTFHAANLARLTSHTKMQYTHDEEKLRYYMPLRSLVDAYADTTVCLRTLLSALVSGDFTILTLSPRQRNVGDAAAANPVQESSSAASTTSSATGGQSGDLRGFSVCLSTARYVLGARLGRTANLHHNFQNLSELSLLLRDRLFAPMRTQQLACLGGACHPYPGLLGLPEELYGRILCYLNGNQLKTMAKVSRDMRYQVEEMRRRAAVARTAR